MSSKKGPVRPLSQEARADTLHTRPELKTKEVFLIGNGASRKNFDLNLLRGKGTIIGCNALYRDFDADILITVDAKLQREIKEAKVHERNTLILVPHNRNTPIPGVLKWRCPGSYNTSGCFGMHFIQEVIQADTCYMLGMDAYIGNVYEHTPNYPSKANMNFNGILSRYEDVLKRKGNTIFVNVNTQDAWSDKIGNVERYKFITYEEFKKEVL